MISFEAQLINIKDWTILHLPLEVSAKLPSRGMTMVCGTINDISFKTVLEPDGKYWPGKGSSHWFRLDNKLLKELSVKAGDTVRVELEPTREWINPEVPPDMQKAIISNKDAHRLWNDITPQAKWDWVRWVRAVKTEETRKKHIEVMMDKLGRGERRPCCFNRNLCSEPYISHNWQLLDPQIS